MAEFGGKDWFRANMQPYLVKIKQEIQAVSAGGGYPIIIDSQNITTFNTISGASIIITGQFFTPVMTVTSSTATITNIVFISEHEATFDIQTTTDQTHVITIASTAGGADINLVSNTVVTNWIDLRTGSSSTWTATSKSGTSVTYGTEGLASTGNVWSNWYKFNSHSWSRSSPKRVSIIMKPATSSFMCGIFSEEHVEGSGTQYYESEIQFYNSGSSAWGFYGTNAAHGGVSQNETNVSTSGINYVKHVLEDNGQVGANYYIYGLSSLTDFNDENNLIRSGVIANNMNADGTTLMVGAVTGTPHRMVAFMIQDM